MLSLPTSGFNRSVNRNNVARSILGDWLEASVIFGADGCSKSDAVDILTEENVADTQDMAHEIVDEGWTEIEGRIRNGGRTVAHNLIQDRIEKTGNWFDDPARSFLLMLSLFDAYPAWGTLHRHANSQGDLFERLTQASCEGIFRDWDVYRAGWSPAGPKDIPTIVRDLTNLLGTPGHPRAAEIAGAAANDAGLDLLVFRPFPDGSECVPFFAVQCASGANWTKKLTEPSTNLWQRLLDSAFKPTRALAIPFVVDRIELARRSTVIEGPLFDRHRLLSVGDGTAAWIEPQLANDLIHWLTPRVAALPFA